MIPFDRIDTAKLTWTQTEPLKPHFDLKSADHPVARLHWPKEYGTLAEAEFHHQKFTFKRSGFWKPYVTVRNEGTPYDLAKIELSWLHDSRIVFTNGKSYGWSLTSMWRQEWSLITDDRTPLITYKTKMTMKGLQAEVDISSAMRQDDELPLLIALGWYLIASASMYDGGGAETAAIMAAIG